MYSCYPWHMQYGIMSSYLHPCYCIPVVYMMNPQYQSPNKCCYYKHRTGGGVTTECVDWNESCPSKPDYDHFDTKGIGYDCFAC